MKEYCFDRFGVTVGVDADVRCEVVAEGDRRRCTFFLSWNAADMASANAPRLKIVWFHPIRDIQYQWHSRCGSGRALHANWETGVSSKISSGSPLHCFYNDAGRNRLTVALDDCVTEITRTLGVREEDGTLECRVEIPLDATGKTDSYQVTLWLDETDCRYEDAIRAVAKWWEEKYPPMPVPAIAKEPTYSFWYSFHQQVRAAEVEEECIRAAGMDMKTVIVDDGWQTDDNSRGYAYCGDWQVATAKIPDMRAHVTNVQALGLKYMLWYSVPFVGRYSEAAKRFEGKTLYFNRSVDTYALDPRYPEVRQYLIDVYVRALKEWNLDGFKLDFIDSFRMAEDTPAFREGMDIVVLEDAVHRLMVDVMKALRAIKPEILIEFRQSYIGPVMREFGNMFRVGDCPCQTDVNRTGIVDLRLTSGETAVHSDMLMWNSADRVENAVCQIQNVIFGTMQLSVRLDRVPGDHVRAIRFWTQFMHENRALLQDAPIYAESPHMLYPVVRTQMDGKSIVACYQRNHVVELSAAPDEVTVLNANSGNALVLAFDEPAEWEMTVYNCLGETVRSERYANGLLDRLDVPECGMIRLKKV